MTRSILILAFLFLFLSGVARAQTNVLTVTEVDGVPTKTSIQKLVFPNGSVTITGSTATIAISGGGGGAPTTATYITQTADATLSAEQALSSLSSGIVRVATGTGVLTSLTTSAGIAANISDETGTGVLVFSISPTLTTPVLGVATATSLNGNTFTTGTYTLTGTAAKVLTFTNTLTLSGTDGTTQTFPTTSATIARTDAGQDFTGSQSIGLGAVASPTAFTVGDTAASTPRGIMSWQSSNDTGSAHLHLRKSRGTFAAPTTILTADLLGRVVFSGYDGASYLESSSIRATAVGTVASTRIPTKMEFLTATDAAPSVATVALTLDQVQAATFASTVAATRFNGLAITNNGTNTLAIAAGKTFTVSNTLTLAGTDGSTLNVGAGGTLGSNAFTSTAFAPIASPTFTGVVTGPSYSANGTGGLGFHEFLTQSSAPTAGASGFREFADSTGRFSWIRQSDGFTRTWDAALTANRVYTLKDATGTVPLLETANIWTVNGALSAPGQTFNGTWIATGGTATTTKPYFLIETTGATSANWSTAGTGLGVNAATGFTGNLLDLQTNGVARMKVSGSGNLIVNGSLTSTTDDVLVGATRKMVVGATVWGQGLCNSATCFSIGGTSVSSPTQQMLVGQSVAAGTSNTAGPNFIIGGPQSTGTGAGGSLVFQTSPAGTTGTALNAYVTAMTIDSTGTTTHTNNIVISTAGKGLQLQSGTGARAGNATLVGGTVTVTNTTVTANTLVLLTRKTSGGTIGTAITYTLSAGASFTINSDNILDTSTFTYILVELN